ncbi:N-acetyltransferase family protein [Rhodovibrionaceae bacterium A322]
MSDREQPVLGNVRQATAMDAHAIATIRVESWRAAYPGLVPDRYLVSMSAERDARGWRESLGRPKSDVTLVAVLAGGPDAGQPDTGKPDIGKTDTGEPDRSQQVVGFISGGPVRRKYLGCDAEVYALYVLPDHQDQGWGRKLLFALFEELSAKGCRSAYLWCLAENPSRFFYEALGGQKRGEREEIFAGAALDEVAYVWPDLFELLASNLRYS